MTSVIHVHPDPRVGPCPVTPAPDTPELQRAMAKEWRRQHAITLASRPDVLARMAGNPVPKWSGK